MVTWKIHGVILSEDQSQIVSTNWEAFSYNSSSMAMVNILPQALSASEADLIEATKAALGSDEVAALEAELQSETDNFYRTFPIMTQNAAQIERNKRNALLEETDFYALSDVTMSDEMTAYRVALRNVPQQEGFPNSITWPQKP